MIALFALLGLIAGWLLELSGDALIHWSGVKPAAPRLRPPAWLCLLRRQPDIERASLVFELFMAILFALVYALHGISGETLWLIAACSYFALITIMDVKYRIVLNVLTYPGLVIALAVNLLVLHQPPLPILLGVFFGFGIFFLTDRVKPGGLGGGDIKLATLIGAAFGFPNVLLALIVSAVTSAAVIIFMLTVRRRSLQASIPYAPFLCIGAMIVLIYSTLPLIG